MPQVTIQPAASLTEGSRAGHALFYMACIDDDAVRLLVVIDLPQRCRQALAGWRRLVPQRSRVRHAVLVVPAVVAVLASKGELGMAVFCMLCFVTFLRPGGMLAFRRASVLEAAVAIGRHRHLILHPLCWNERRPTTTTSSLAMMSSSCLLRVVSRLGRGALQQTCLLPSGVGPRRRQAVGDDQREGSVRES